MALFDRNDNRDYGYRDDPGRGRGGGFVDRAQNAVRRGWDRVENAFEGQDVHRGYDGGYGYGGGMGRGANAGGRPMDREGGLHQRNSWSDGAWTADAGERADREWNLGNRGRHDYDRDDTTPFQAGWRAGGMSGGMGMGRGMEGDRGWNRGGGGWGHTGSMSGGMDRYDRGYTAGGGVHRGGGFLDRAQNAVRRGWDNLEDRFDRDDDRGDMHLGSRSMRGGTSWAGRYDRDWHQPSDVRGYRDEHGHYGLTHTGGMMGGGAGMAGGMNRYASDYDRGLGVNRGGMGYDRGYKGREQTDAGDPFGDRHSHTPIRVTGRGNPHRYDESDRGSRDWF
ncbi:MAG TPA: hypothetical protein VF142_21635 [Longimicrobium sp.]